MATQAAPYQTVKWKLRRLPGGGWEGIVRVPGQVCATTTRARAPTKAGALAAAAGLAESALESPILQAVLPPGAGVALQLTKQLASAAKVGKLADVAASVVGPGATRLAKALGGLFG